MLCTRHLLCYMLFFSLADMHTYLVWSDTDLLLFYSAVIGRLALYFKHNPMQFCSFFLLLCEGVNTPPATGAAGQRDVHVQYQQMCFWTEKKTLKKYIYWIKEITWNFWRWSFVLSARKITCNPTTASLFFLFFVLHEIDLIYFFTYILTHIHKIYIYTVYIALHLGYTCCTWRPLVLLVSRLFLDVFSGTRKRWRKREKENKYSLVLSLRVQVHYDLLF